MAVWNHRWADPIDASVGTELGSDKPIASWPPRKNDGTGMVSCLERARLQPCRKVTLSQVVILRASARRRICGFRRAASFFTALAPSRFALAWAVTPSGSAAEDIRSSSRIVIWGRLQFFLNCHPERRFAPTLREPESKDMRSAATRDDPLSRRSLRRSRASNEVAYIGVTRSAR